MAILTNIPLVVAVSAILIAQFIKVPLHYIAFKKVDWKLFTSTGGMPSSHSAAVTALTTAIAIEEGLHSNLFAISAIFAVIVMFDATGVRRHAGEQATVLNKLVADFHAFLEERKYWQGKPQDEKRRELKELLGHQPIEVFFGAATGLLLAMLTYFIIGF